MTTQAHSESVWNSIETTPEQAENMRLHAALMIGLREHIDAQGWSQRQAARRLGVAQPRISDLVRGRIRLFALESLVKLASSVGLQVGITVSAAARAYRRPVTAEQRRQATRWCVLEIDRRNRQGRPSSPDEA